VHSFRELDNGWQSGGEVGHTERPEQRDGDDADFRRGSKGVDRCSDGLDARPHDDDDALRVRSAVILEQAVHAAGERREPSTRDAP
jgi:hypothetical protein